MNMGREYRRQEYQLPVLTVLTMLWCVAVFLMINLQADKSWVSVAKWGYYSDDAIFKGAPWALLTGAFVHVDPIHLAFNMYWLFILGGALEKSIGWPKWILFVVTSAFVSSGLQLLSGNAGIGFSGVGYAMLGFCWLTKGRYPEVARVVNQRLVNMFLGWGVLCIVLTYAKVMNIGNFAHAGGLAFGALVGLAVDRPKFRPLSAVGLVVLAACAITSVVWNPFSADWVSGKAIKAHDREDFAEAARQYRRALDLGEDPRWIWSNLARIYGYREDAANYKDAIEHLRALDHDGAQEVIDVYGEPK